MKETSKRSQGLIVLALIIAAAAGYYYFFMRPDPDAIGRQITGMIQQRLDSTPPLSKLHMTVKSVDVMHAEGNKYVGVAHIDLRGELHDVPVDVTADGNQVMYQIQQGSFMFAAPALMSPQGQ